MKLNIYIYTFEVLQEAIIGLIMANAVGFLGLGIFIPDSNTVLQPGDAIKDQDQEKVLKLKITYHI